MSSFSDSRFSGLLTLGVAVLGFAGVSVWMTGGPAIDWTRFNDFLKSTGRSSPTVEAPGYETDRPSLMKKLDLKITEWKREGFGTVLLVSFDIVNNNWVSVNDVTVRCTMLGQSGTELGRSDRTIYWDIQSGSKLTVTNLNFGFVHDQTYRLRCNPMNV